MSLFTETASWVENEHRMFADTATRLFAAELAPNIEKWADEGIVPRDFWRKVGAEGVMGGAVPEAYGGFGDGMGFDAITTYAQGRVGGIPAGAMASSRS